MGKQEQTQAPERVPQRVSDKPDYLSDFAYHLAAIVAENQRVSIETVVNAAVIDWAGPLVARWVREYIEADAAEVAHGD